MMIKIENLSFAYGQREVLKNVSLTAKSGQLLSVLGPNGVGKSTLFRCILGLLNGYSGHISIDDQDVRSLSARELAGRVAYIPQSHYLSFNYTVADMILMGTTHRLPATASPGKKERELAGQAMAQIGISHLAQRDFSRISGGEKQLTLIARALAQQSPILILDEPVANLDFGNQIKILSLLRQLAENGQTIIQSTHNPDQTFLFSHHVVAVKSGNILADGAPAEVLTSSLLSEIYDIKVEVHQLNPENVRICVPVI